MLVFEKKSGEFRGSDEEDICLYNGAQMDFVLLYRFYQLFIREKKDCFALKQTIHLLITCSDYYAF